MRRARNFLVIGLLLLASACTDTGQVKSLPDNPENRAAAADRYMKAMPAKDMLQSLAARIAPNLPEKDRAAFTEVMNSPDLEKTVSRITKEALVKNFTVGELDAMTAFYGSPEGQSASKKFGTHMMGIMPQIQQEVKKAVDEKQKAQCPPGAGAPKAPPAPGAPASPAPVAPKAAPVPPAPAAPKAAPVPPAPAAPKAAPVPQAPVAPKAAPAPKEPPAPTAPVAPKAPAAPQAPKEAPAKN
jgi:hypothetical protein